MSSRPSQPVRPSGLSIGTASPIGPGRTASTSVATARAARRGPHRSPAARRQPTVWQQEQRQGQSPEPGRHKQPGLGPARPDGTGKRAGLGHQSPVGVSRECSRQHHAETHREQQPTDGVARPMPGDQRTDAGLYDERSDERRLGDRAPTRDAECREELGDCQCHGGRERQRRDSPWKVPARAREDRARRLARPSS